MLVQPDGNVIVLFDAAENSSIIQTAGIPIPATALQDAAEDL
ncbi:hypothetical protein [Roseovarius albus]|nr:hypothetical protein [Roseovarius albus]